MKPLIETNTHLKNMSKAKISNKRSARTSCGVEGIVPHPRKNNKTQPDSSKTKAAFKKIKQRLRSS